RGFVLDLAIRSESMRMTASDARRRFAAARVARLATVTSSGTPHIVPVTFAVDGDLIYTAVDAKPKTTTVLQRLRNIRANSAVAVLTDQYRAAGRRLWWAGAEGQAVVLDEPGAMLAPVRRLVERYPQYQESPPEGPVIVVSVHRWSGWQAAPR